MCTLVIASLVEFSFVTGALFMYSSFAKVKQANVYRRGELSVYNRRRQGQVLQAKEEIYENVFVDN